MMSAAAEYLSGGFSSAVILRATDKTIDFLESNYSLTHATEEPLIELRTNLTMKTSLSSTLVLPTG